MVKTIIPYEQCPRFEKTFGILGRKWNGLIIDALLTEGSQRFRDLANMVDKCSDRVLVERLKELEEEDLIERVLQEESARPVYRLTKRGRDLSRVMKDIHDWSEKWYTLEDCQ
ncbi:winged helix-turn-helix transcriptional regulator [Liquorilactobacillus satsumensis]|uniref:Transcriptional regulator n=1 Tax=Liquorilactobacillus satsumensis DSM 16230 = JCM 12392 TaxID=1423801 RepID=A0A0R1UXS7_9LACO|nr:helix-turn-helix domain-containing protein [Liquorilactobacillus satsumensis]KRL98023.1 transcriptional regulator [Liquorilactobacillus satsumensis DSM 16230 = JCM 12392]MCP9312312.1 helix-turn-helix transcriptional regulator [Liquorilactobacillus satsumensis]MCP9327713.1 helix-turn-helix transcriptional regulator [Liquorilactobacillus satsumensis]MCP9359684.1 helix-turn-helix transcriptional regulator [Liquorilactobacillus satsumensis]